MSSVVSQTDKNLRQHKKEFSDIQYESKNISKFRSMSGMSLRQKDSRQTEPTENRQLEAQVKRLRRNIVIDDLTSDYFVRKYAKEELEREREQQEKNKHIKAIG